MSTTALPSIIDPTALLLASAALPHSYETPVSHLLFRLYFLKILTFLTALISDG